MNKFLQEYKEKNPRNRFFKNADENTPTTCIVDDDIFKIGDEIYTKDGLGFCPVTIGGFFTSKDGFKCAYLVNGLGIYFGNSGNLKEYRVENVSMKNRWRELKLNKVTLIN